MKKITRTRLIGAIGLWMGASAFTVHARVPEIDQMKIQCKIAPTLDSETDCESKANACVEAFRSLENSVIRASPSQGDVMNLDTIFRTRIELRSHFESIQSEQRNCSDAFMRIQSAALHAEDAWALWLGEKIKTPIFGTKDTPATKEDISIPEEEIRFQSGDILLSHGGAIVSSAIARMPISAPHDYSHMAIVVVHPTSHKIYTVEAHIELGSVVRPLSEWAQGNKARAAHYRLKGHPGVANRVALWAANEVQKYQKDHDGENLPYDFSATVDSDRKWFCTEVVTQAFQAIAPELKLGTQSSSMQVPHRDLIRKIGIAPDSVFMPGDLIRDPRFQLIREWRDLGRIEKIRNQDRKMDLLFQKTLLEGIPLKTSSFHQSITPILISLRKVPGLGEQLLGSKIPASIPVPTLEAILSIERAIQEE